MVIGSLNTLLGVNKTDGSKVKKGVSQKTPYPKRHLKNAILKNNNIKTPSFCHHCPTAIKNLKLSNVFYDGVYSDYVLYNGLFVSAIKKGYFALFRKGEALSLLNFTLFSIENHFTMYKLRLF